jgi:uncharacterized membrane protein YcfT
MPDFFMISGLFLAHIINRPWQQYLDRKVVHFAYFRLLRMTIQFALKAPLFAQEYGTASVIRLYPLLLIDPIVTLCFIYLLPVFFVFIKLTKHVPVLVIWLIGAALKISHVNTGWMVPHEFAAPFVYCYTGYILATPIFALTARAQARPWLGVGGLLLWGLVNGALVYVHYEKLPFIWLLLDLAGAAAVVPAAALMAKSDWFRPLRYCGCDSIAIYLVFFLPMAVTRTVLIKSGLIADVGTMAALITIAGVISALVLFWIVRGTWARFLLERPTAFHLVPPKRAVLQPAE